MKSTKTLAGEMEELNAQIKALGNALFSSLITYGYKDLEAGQEIDIVTGEPV
jgi:hypothetical protein